MNDSDNQEQKSGPVAIKIEGKLRNSQITDNVSVGMPLLEAGEIEDSSIERNRTFLADGSPSIYAEKIEVIGRDKLEQHGVENKAQTVNIRGNNKHKTWFSMTNPVIWIIATVLAAIIFWLFKLYAQR